MNDHTSTALPILHTPGMPARFNRLRFMTADAGSQGTPGVTPGTPDAPTGQEPAAAPETPAQPTPGTDDTQPATPEAPSAPAEWDGKVESLPEPVQKMIRDLRNENAAKRTTATAAEQAQRDAIRSLAKAAGIELPDDPDAKPDADKLAQQLTASQQAARDAAVELAVFKAAAAEGANPQTLLDSRSFMSSLADVDPTDTQAVTAAIKTAVTNDARFKVAQAAARSGGDLPGGTGEGTVTREQFNAMSTAEKNALFKTNPTTYRQLAG